MILAVYKPLHESTQRSMGVYACQCLQTEMRLTALNLSSSCCPVQEERRGPCPGAGMRHATPWAAAAYGFVVKSQWSGIGSTDCACVVCSEVGAGADPQEGWRKALTGQHSQEGLLAHLFERWL